MTKEELTLQHIQNNTDVIHFIDKVMVQLYNEEDAKAIKDELIDHLYSLALDYLNAGYNNEAAIHKALLQMGDPTEIGYSFTDYEAMKKRRLKLISFKVLSILLFSITICVTIFFVEKADRQAITDQTGLELTDYQLFKLDLETQSGLEQFTSYLSWYIDKYSFALFYIVYIPLILYIDPRNNRFHGIPLKKLDISTEPLLILWPYKKAFPWEYFLIALLFSPIVFVMIILMVSEGTHILEPILFFITIGSSIWLFFHSEKYRIPKYVILNDGILIKDSLISWVAIDSVSWVQDYSSKNNHYKLIIKNKTNSANSNFTINKTIFVNHNQHAQVSNILNQHLQ